ncbi:MAG: tetratricopeptide repeat protein [candidate division KSB1 bacterium]|nr:tetratricopeptide repeat protein [candidate division KSB1 bacterium]
MDNKAIRKTICVTLDLNDINGEVEQLFIAENENDKREIVKKLLSIPDHFNDEFDYKIISNKLQFTHYLSSTNLQAENLHKSAIAFARNGDLDKAISYWNKAIELNANDPHYFFNLGVAYFELKRYLDAIDALTRTLAICPVYFKANLILGIAYLKIRKFENAKKHIERSLLENKNNPMAYLNLGAISSILKDYKTGITMFEKAISLAPQEPGAYMGLGKIYLILGDTTKANYYFKKVIEYDKKGNLANYAKRLISTQQSETNIGKAIDLPNGTNPETYYSEGYRNYIIGNFENAIKFYQKYLAIKSDDDYVWYALGEAQLRAGKPELAVESFKRAAKLSPSKGLYFKELGIAFEKLKYYEKAIISMKKASELGKSDSITHTIWGKALFELGRYLEAKEQLEISLKSNKNNLMAKYYLALTLLKTKEIEDAIYYFEEVTKSKIETPLKESAEMELKKLAQ